MENFPVTTSAQSSHHGESGPTHGNLPPEDGCVPSNGKATPLATGCLNGRAQRTSANYPSGYGRQHPDRAAPAARLVIALPGVVLSEIAGTPAHHAAVPDPPHTRADVAMGHRAHRRPGPQKSRLHPVQALLRWTGQGVCRNVGPPHPCREVLALPDSQDFQQYIHIDRSLKPPLMRPSLLLVRKAIDRMWFRRHWYWPSGYIVVGIIVALLTNNIHLSSLSGVLLSDTGGTSVAVHTRCSPLPPPGLSHPRHRYHLTPTARRRQSLRGLSLSI